LEDKLPSERKGRLDALGFDWDPLQMDWQEAVSYLQTFKEREGHCRVPPSYKENGFLLGSWVRRQRGDKDRMSASRRQKLDELGFVWDPFETDWEEGFRYLTMYKEREGDCRVPRTHMENGFSLGHWVNRQRHKKRLSEVQRQRLDKLGFVWDPFETDWEEGFRYIAMYKEREGHCLVPQAHKENGFCLGRWVANQRSNKEALSDERRQQLEKLGFVWKIVRSPSPTIPVIDQRAMDRHETQPNQQVSQSVTVDPDQGRGPRD